MTNKLYDSKGQLIGYIRTVEKNQYDDIRAAITGRSRIGLRRAGRSIPGRLLPEKLSIWMC